MDFNLNTIMQLVTLVGVGFAIYRSWSVPDEQASKKLAVLEASCVLKHQAIDENIVLIKNNHLKHIEEDIAMIKNEQTRIITILEERLPRK